MPTDAVDTYGGSFTDAWVHVSAAAGGKLDLEVRTFGKAPTMVGESTMLTFAIAPTLKSSGAWSLDKINTKVDPEDVIDGYGWHSQLRSDFI